MQVLFLTDYQCRECVTRLTAGPTPAGVFICFFEVSDFILGIPIVLYGGFFPALSASQCLKIPARGDVHNMAMLPSRCQLVPAQRSSSLPNQKCRR